VAECVVKGKKEQIISEIQKLIDDGVKPQAIIEEHLIKGINVVGDLYDKKKYFLPQLIAGANAMEIGMKHIEPLLSSESGEAKATIVIATVEGDIHDIGKNLVALMLKNYGFNVIDMGKDVPAEKIIDKAVEVDADVIGLSALMTTTMMRMEDVVKLAKEKGCRAQIIIGGACINESFKDEINADGYSADAAECVKLVQNLLR
jgi:5-methyltetrahydrofolate--homocysteine methyltransferase